MPKPTPNSAVNGITTSMNTKVQLRCPAMAKAPKSTNTSTADSSSETAVRAMIGHSGGK